jgi:VCBS repeat-containing protein
MSYHSEGTMTLVNDEGKTHTYKVNTYGNRLVLNGTDGEWHYTSDKPPVLVEKLKKEIEDLQDTLAEKMLALQELGEACK